MFCRGLRGVVFSHFRIFPKPQFRTLLQVGKSMVLPGSSLADEKQKAKEAEKIQKKNMVQNLEGPGRCICEQLVSKW